MEDPLNFIGKSLPELPSPVFVVSSSKVRQNALRMLNKCSELGIALRPHVKTHKTIEGALLQTGGKRSGIVVSTVQEAWFYIQHGFEDILLGRPVSNYVLQRCSNFHQILSFLVNSEEGLAAVLNEEHTKNPLKVLLKISTGYERAGIPWNDFEVIKRYAEELNSCIGTEFSGLYVHCGNSYTTEKDAVETVRDDSVARLISVRDQLLAFGIKCLHLGIGSTPSCSLSVRPDSDMSQLTEVHPGNYIFYDCQQESYGSCTRENIAGRVMTRVVSHHPSRNQILIDLGFTGLTKQGLDLAVPGYCAVDGHPNLKLVAMTQELGKLESIDGSKLDFSSFPVDSVLFVFPYHACATAGMYDHYFVHDDQGKVVDVWRPTRGW